MAFWALPILMIATLTQEVATLRVLRDLIAVSDRAPISGALWEAAYSRKAVIELFSHFEDIGEAVRRSRSCTRSRKFRFPSKEVGTRFPLDNTTTSGCRIQLTFAGKGEHVWSAIDTVRQRLNHSSPSIIQQTNVDWKHAYPSISHNPFAHENCEIQQIAAVRNRGTWMLWIRILSTPVQSVLKSTGSSMTEFVLPFGKSQQASIKKRDGSLMKNATTTFLDGGTRSPCCKERLYRNMLVKHKKWQVYAAETIQASNVATLMLPLLLCVVPVTLFIDERTKVGVGYSVLSKVLNVLPLAFKGAELIHLAKNPPHVTRSAAQGLDRENGLGMASTIVIRCAVDSKLVPIGVSFITTSILCMMFGLFLDSRVWRKQVRYKREIRQRPTLVRNCIDCYCFEFLNCNSRSVDPYCEDNLTANFPATKNL